MLVWETDPTLRDTEARAAFADVWRAIPKVVFSRTLDRVQGNGRPAEASVAEEATATLDATERDVSPFLPPVTDKVPLELIETRTFGSRVIYERYRRSCDEST